jgi:hypothetical protein
MEMAKMGGGSKKAPDNPGALSTIGFLVDACVIFVARKKTGRRVWWLFHLL